MVTGGQPEEPQTEAGPEYAAAGGGNLSNASAMNALAVINRIYAEL